MTVRLFERSVAKLPVVSRARRGEIARLPERAEAHAPLVRELACFDVVEHTPAPDAAPAGESLRVVAWNLERGRFVPESAALLARAGARAALLSELDYGMSRTRQLHTARELARRLDGGCAYAVEFLELGLGTEREREEWCEDPENAVGYHGGAILAVPPLERPAVVRFGLGGEWFDGSRGERRVGGRMAVLATVRLGDVPVTLASVHLESHSDAEHRGAQMRGLLAALEEYAPGAPALVGGDLNTLSMSRQELLDAPDVGALVLEDPDRFSRPMEHEPLFDAARVAGFDWTAPNVLGEGTYRIRLPVGALRTPLKLDWLFARGLEVSEPEIIEALDPESGEMLSDHDAIAVTIRPAR